MSNDLITRLREEAECYRGKTQSCLADAVKRIEQLEAELRTAKEGLEFLDALMKAGVDNWSGYDYAIDILEGGR